MDGYIIYGVITAIMLGITFFFYTYKNWLPLRKNRHYLGMMVFLLVLVLSELVLCLLTTFDTQNRTGNTDRLMESLSAVGTIGFFYFYVMYTVASTRRVLRRRKAGVVVFTVLMFLFTAGYATIPFVDLYMDFVLFDTEFFLWCCVPIYWICLVFCFITVCNDKDNLTPTEFLILIFSQIALIVVTVVRVSMPQGNPCTYMTMCCILIAYYLLLHNNDQYISYTSRCFDGNGFRTVAAEHGRYQIDFCCLGICINNIDSITSVCSQDELTQLQRIFGRQFRRMCGRHRVYHLHSFEYLVMFSDSETAASMQAKLARSIPGQIKIHGKNVSVVCGFYSLRFSDAAYDITELNRILVSMRYAAGDLTDRNAMLQYSGQDRKKVKEKLDDLAEISACLLNDSFDFEVTMIRSADGKEKMCEFLLCRHLEDRRLNQERIWDLAGQSGVLTDVGLATTRLVCEYLRVNHWASMSFDRYHINLLASQLDRESVAKQIVGIFSRYDIPGDKLCIEVTFDRDTDYAYLPACFAVFKEYGICLLLDQFGTSICNLKNVLNLPFDMVKLNHYMVTSFCEGRNYELVYLVDMLKKKNWEIVLDGIDEWEMVTVLHEYGMEDSYVQGLAVTKLIRQEEGDIMKVRLTDYAK